MSARAAFAAIWAEIVAPSRAGEPPYLRMLIAIGHTSVGAAAMEIAGQGAAAAISVMRCAVPLAYWLFKERADLRRGGSVRDSLTDAAFVALVPILSIWPDFGWTWSTVIAAAVLAAIL